MSQRDSGYARIERDAYETPEWVTAALVPHIPKRVKKIWEPACGSGKMVRELVLNGYDVHFTDICMGADFLLSYHRDLDAIITNPPYDLAPDFIERALLLTQRMRGVVGMLLRTDFHHARTRKLLFKDCPQFAKQLVLTERIRWIEGSDGSPSFNHAWFIWDWRHEGPPVLAYH